MKDYILTHHDVHMLLVVLNRYIQEGKKKEEMYRDTGLNTEKLLDVLTEMLKTESDFLAYPIGAVEGNEGFGEPDEEIVGYAKSQNLQLNLRSKVVQRVLRFRMSQEEPRGQ